MPMARALHEHLEIPADGLLREPDVDLDNPLADMRRCSLSYANRPQTRGGRRLATHQQSVQFATPTHRRRAALASL